MADEYSRPPHSRKIGAPPRHAWTALHPLTGAELVARDKTSLDLFRLKDDSLADLDNLPEPADLAEGIIENIEAGLENFRRLALSLAK